MALQRAPAESPTAGDEELVETADQPVSDAPESSAGTDDNTASSAESDAAPSERVVEKPPTALDKLRAKLVAKAPEDAPPAEIADADLPETTSEPEVEPAEAEAQAETEETAPDETADDDPLHGFTEKEVKHPSNKGMVTRIRDLALERKKLKQTVQDLEPIREAGQFLTKFQADAGLDAGEVVSALELSAAFKRGDPKALEALEAAAAQLRTDLGMPDPVREPALAPLQGVLSQDYKDMIEVLGVPEADVRLFAALQAKLKAPPAPAAARPQPRPAQRPAAPLVPQVDRARLQQLQVAANETVLDYLETVKVARDKASEHMAKNLWPYLKPLSPGQDPSKIPPEERLRLVQIAQQKHTLARAKAAAVERAKNPPPPKSTSTTAAPASPSTPRTALDQLKLKMTGKR